MIKIFTTECLVRLDEEWITVHQYFQKSEEPPPVDLIVKMTPYLIGIAKDILTSW